MSGLSYEEKLRLSEDAKRYLQPGSLLNIVFTRIVKDALEVFQSAPLNSPAATDAHAKLRVMNEIKSSLKAVMDDIKVTTRNVEEPGLRAPKMDAWNI